MQLSVVVATILLSYIANTCVLYPNDSSTKICTLIMQLLQHIHPLYLIKITSRAFSGGGLLKGNHCIPSGVYQLFPCIHKRMHVFTRRLVASNAIVFLARINACVSRALCEPPNSLRMQLTLVNYLTL